VIDLSIISRLGDLLVVHMSAVRRVQVDDEWPEGQQRKKEEQFNKSAMA
jgi:hypothetical protein